MCRGLQWLHIYLEMDLGATDIDAAGLAKDVVRKPRGQARPPEPADLVLLGRAAREWQGFSRYCALVIIALPRSGFAPATQQEAFLNPLTIQAPGSCIL